jgi:hypothetical protein
LGPGTDGGATGGAKYVGPDECAVEYEFGICGGGGGGMICAVGGRREKSGVVGDAFEPERDRLCVCGRSVLFGGEPDPGPTSGRKCTFFGEEEALLSFLLLNELEELSLEFVLLSLPERFLDFCLPCPVVGTSSEEGI